MKMVNQDPFSNGTEYMIWEERNCDRCIKDSHMTKDQMGYTKIKCSIQRDIITRMYSNEPIKQKTIDICNMRDCPSRKEHWPKRKKRARVIPKEQLTLDLM